jgi:outer membrane cobalamin receptor
MLTTERNAMHRISALACICLILTIFIPKHVMAESTDPIPTMETVIVSASRITSEATNTTANFTIISREVIEKANSASVVDVLRQVPGLHIDQQGGRGGLSSLYLRGSDPNFTLVLIDGIRMNDPTNARGGSFDFSTLSVDNIERIEIVRGPISSVHGSDAIAGVINIVTQMGTAEPEVSAGGEIGTEEFHRGNIHIKGPVSDVAEFALGASYVDSGNAVQGDQHQSGEFNGKLSISLSDATEISTFLRFNNSHNENFPDDSGGPTLAVIRDTDSREAQEFTAGASIDHDLSSSWDLTLKVNWLHREDETASPGVAPGVRDPFGIPANSSDSTFKRTQLSASSRFSGVEHVKFGLGIDAQFEAGVSDSIVEFFGVPVPGRFDLERHIYSPFFELQYEIFDGLLLQGGLRIDIPEDFDTEYSPRIGALYKFNADLTTLKFNWGKGFKLPSFYALGNPVVGNADLIPETSEGFDFGVTQTFWDKRLTIGVTPFYSRFFDLIDFDEGPPPQLVNRSKATAQGIEVSVDIQPHPKWSLLGHLTYTETDIEDTTEELRNRPEWRGGINLNWNLHQDLSLNTAVLYVGEVLDSSIPTGDRMLDDYIRVDVAGTWQPRTNVEFGLAIDNLFDTDYEENIGFPAPGIQARVSTRVRF